MAKQSCDPFRGGLCAQATVFVRPGVAVTKGDLMAMDTLFTDFAVPFNKVASVAAAATNFVGAANAGMAADAVNRRMVVNVKGRYKYPLSSAAASNVGQYIHPVLNGGSTACEAQKVSVNSTSTNSIGRVVVAAPDLENQYNMPATTPYVTAVNTTSEALSLNENPFAVGELVRVINDVGTPDPPAGLTSGNTYYVVYSDGLDIKVSATRGGTAVNLTDAGTGTTYVIPHTVRGTSDEVEAQIISNAVAI